MKRGSMDAAVSRAQFLTVLVDTLGLGEAKRNVYPNVADLVTSDGQRVVQAALNAGILDSSFCSGGQALATESPVTGEEAISILVHAYHYFFDSQIEEDGRELRLDAPDSRAPRYLREARRLNLLPEGAGIEKKDRISSKDASDLLQRLVAQVPPEKVAESAKNPVRYAFWGTDRFLPKQRFSSVGVFGTLSSSYNEVPMKDGVYNHMAAVTGGHYAPGTLVRDACQKDCGLLCFSARYNSESPEVYWYRYDGEEDLRLGSSVFPGTKVSYDWQYLSDVTLRWDTVTRNEQREIASETYLSRAFPAILFVTEGAEWSWRSGSPSMRFDRVAFLDGSLSLRTIEVGSAAELPLDSGLGRPWILIWRRGEEKRQEVVPLLIRLQRKPTRIAVADGTLRFEFGDAAGAIGVMPLNGIRRPTGAAADAWREKPPQEAVGAADFWSSALAAFPLRHEERAEINEAARRVVVTNRFEYRVMDDDWATEPRYLAPVPPMAALAKQHGYPVVWESGEVTTSDVATFYGPYSYQQGREVGYSVPMQSGVKQMYTPIRASGDAELERLQERAVGVLLTKDPGRLDSTFGEKNHLLQWYSRLFPLLPDEQKEAYRRGITDEFDKLYHLEEWVTIVQPTGGSTWVYNNGFGMSGYNWDSEWVLGRMLFQAWEAAYWVNPEIALKHWHQFEGNYAYFRIFWEWAWQGTMTYQTGNLQWFNPVPLVLDGIESTARLARMAGNEEVYRDAVYRAAVQSSCFYGMWYLTTWLKEQDYLVRNFRNGRSVNRRLDDYSGVVFENPVFWLTEQAGIEYPAEKRLQTWLGGILPQDTFHGHRMVNDHLFAQLYGLIFRDLKEKYPSLVDSAYAAVRSILYGEDPDLTAALHAETTTQEEQKQHRTTAATILFRSLVPQVWAPVTSVRVLDNHWDAAAKRLTTRMTGTVTGAAAYEWSWRRKTDIDAKDPRPHPGAEPAEVRVDGRKAPYERTDGGFWRVRLALDKGREVVVEVLYSSSGE